MQQLLPNRYSFEFVQVVLKEFDADAAVERGVERFHSVGRQEQDALLLLEQPQENAHHRVAVDVRAGPLLQEYVCLVQQQDGVPRVADFEDLLQTILERAHISA